MLKVDGLLQSGCRMWDTPGVPHSYQLSSKLSAEEVGPLAPPPPPPPPPPPHLSTPGMPPAGPVALHQHQSYDGVFSPHLSLHREDDFAIASCILACCCVVSLYSNPGDHPVAVHCLCCRLTVTVLLNNCAAMHTYSAVSTLVTISTNFVVV